MALENRLLVLLSQHVSDITAKSILSLSLERSRTDLNHLQPASKDKLMTEIRKGLSVFVKQADEHARCIAAIEQALEEKQARALTSVIEVVVDINGDPDIVLARNKGWYLCDQMEFPGNTKVSITTAITELARNIVQYAEQGKIELRAVPGDPPYLEIVARDSGPGITDVVGIMMGRYKSTSGLGLGLRGVKQIMDDFDIRTAPGKGTTVVVKKYRK